MADNGENPENECINQSIMSKKKNKNPPKSIPNPEQKLKAATFA